MDIGKLKDVNLVKENIETESIIRKLDRLSLKVTIKIPLLYIMDIDSLKYGVDYHEDKQYEDFISSLGLRLNEKHVRTGNFEHLRSLLHNTSLIYDSNCIHELVFMSPASQPVKYIEEMERVIKESEIIVIWNARSSNPYDNRRPSFLNTFPRSDSTIRRVIILTPLRNGLFKINVSFEKGTSIINENIPTSPLFNNTVVSKFWLSLLLKFSCIIYSKSNSIIAGNSLYSPLNDFSDIQAQRKQLIKELEKYSISSSSETDFLYNFLS